MRVPEFPVYFTLTHYLKSVALVPTQKISIFKKHKKDEICKPSNFIIEKALKEAEYFTVA